MMFLLGRGGGLRRSGYPKLERDVMPSIGIRCSRVELGAEYRSVPIVRKLLSTSISAGMIGKRKATRLKTKESQLENDITSYHKITISTTT